MPKPQRKGAEEARSQLPDLLAAAERGRQTIITRHRPAVALLVPIGASDSNQIQRSLLPLTGTGRGLFGRDSRNTLRKVRDEWSR